MLMQGTLDYHLNQTQLSNESEKSRAKVDMMKKSNIQSNEKMDMQDCYAVSVLSVRLRSIRKTTNSHACGVQIWF